MLNTRLKNMFFKCEIKTASRCQQVTDKRVIAIESFKQMINSRMKHSHCSETQNSAVAVFGIIFVVKIEQKQAIWCLKRKSLN